MQRLISLLTALTLLVVLALPASLGTPAVPIAAASARLSADRPPETLSSVTFGGSRLDAIVDVAIAGDGGMYVLGTTDSPDFPTLRATQPRFGSGSADDGSSPPDAFVVSLAPDGRTVRYSTFIGGSGQEQPAAIAVTADGLAYVAGTTESPDFPLVGAGFLGTALRGRDDGFLVALAPDGALLASGYLGGTERDHIGAIALTPDGALVVVGFTSSWDFPAVAALQPAHAGGETDAFITVADAGLRRLRFSSFLGGDANDDARAALVGSDGTIYVGGGTESRTFPIHDALQATLPERARMASFLVGFHPNGGALRFSTYLGGSSTAEGINDLAIDADGNLLVAVGIYQTGAVRRLTANGRAMAYSTYLGPPSGVAFDAAGHSFVAITPYPHKTGFVLPPGVKLPCEPGLPEIVELDAQGQVVAVMIAPVAFGAFALSPDGRMVLVGSAWTEAGWPPGVAGADADARVVVVRAGHGQMAWRWPPPFDGAGPRAFFQLWARSDAQQGDGRLASGASWRWGPQPISAPICESIQANGGAYRYVQYFDKGRMEQNYSEPSSLLGWVSGGRLAVELIGGQIQLGPTDVEARQPSDEAVVGDPAANNPQAPTYRALGAVSWPMNRERVRPAPGALVTQRIDAVGAVTDDPELERYGMRLGPYDRQLGHNIAAVFVTWALGDEAVPLGLPLSEPYWVRARVGGQERELLVQPFERGVLSYTPHNPPAWRVELGNIGRHYLIWRYGQ